MSMALKRQVENHAARGAGVLHLCGDFLECAFAAGRGGLGGYGRIGVETGDGGIVGGGQGGEAGGGPSGGLLFPGKLVAVPGAYEQLLEARIGLVKGLAARAHRSRG